MPSLLALPRLLLLPTATYQPKGKSSVKGVLFTLETISRVALELR